MLSYFRDGSTSSFSVEVLQNFLMPQRDLFGYCDNFKSALFLRDVDPNNEGSCVQKFTNLQQASQTFMDP